jgi:hypothetical protein
MVRAGNFGRATFPDENVLECQTRIQPTWRTFSTCRVPTHGDTFSVGRGFRRRALSLTRGRLGAFQGGDQLIAKGFYQISPHFELRQLLSTATRTSRASAHMRSYLPWPLNR